ncbi:hypothetical protein Sa4125_36990 [Aureimonas sp. SA4125]|uniref:DUF3772 domain-containing protein n=1 Tax=Aureimonas sp. SA4125 TaxID=2826993 RepID=UPI001CC7D3EB|nr:DUF3772 domain-containing protein [Aureimonas sp. SA4125]BDA86157.1 hypothetical protein Sa4125_36990 [Aureimonas sp. SA4125]
MTFRNLLRSLSLVWILAFAVAVMPAAAQDAAAPETDPIVILDQQAAELAAIKRAADAETSSDEKAELRDRGMVAGSTANTAVAQLVPQLAEIDARIAELGPVLDDEAPDIKAQRQRLDAERGELDSTIKRGRLLAADAKEMIDRMIREINEAFNRDTFKKVASPLSPTLWADLAGSLSDDSARLSDFVRVSVLAIPKANIGLRLVFLAAGLVLAAILLLPVRRGLRQVGRRFAVEQVPGTRARRSALALWFVVVGTLTSTLAFLIVYQALNWGDFLTRWTRPLAETLAITAGIGGFMVSLGAGLLLSGQPSWRLPPISDEAVGRLRPYPGLAAILTFLSVLLIEGGKAVGVSPTAAIFLNYAVTASYCILISTLLIGLMRYRRTHPEGAEPSAQTTIATVATLLGWGAVVIALVAALQGYVNLALFVSRQTIWTAIVSAATYLLLIVVDDVSTTFLSGESRLGRSLHAGLGLRKAQVDQLGVIVSALLRLAILVVAAILLSGPLGPGASSLFYQFGNSSEIQIGGFSIVPGSILKATIVLFVGIALMRGVRRWLDDRFLPATDLDPGARNSVSTIVSYAGIILAGFWALSTLGIGVERIALVVSALSVGIGFGLQAITQNFVSGIILLAERPVKIGDTVRLGADEGEVRRISVRSTEIQIADRSTLIVPNSELITKSIRNMTMANPLGRVQIGFATPLDVDAAAVRDTLLDILGTHEAILASPAPSVFIDGIEESKVVFKAFAFVASPGSVYATRSAIYFTLLERFKAEDIKLVVA